MGVGPATTTVVTEDKTPPMAPAHVDIKTSEAGGYITWDPNAESDLAGYRVFRSERADTGFRAVSDTLIMTNGFFDASYRAGWYYAVSAIDEFGNESPLSAPFRGP